MKLKTLATAMILASVPMTGAFAAALDRSGQSISAFLQPGNYFEAGISVLDPNVSGKVKNGYTPSAAVPPAAVGLQNTSLDDMAGDYYFPSAALKLQLNDNFSFGLIYDQPFGADATYSTGDTGSAALGGAGLFHDGNESTSVEVDTQNISVILGFQPTENWNFYGGGVYQTVKGNVQLRGYAYSGTNNFGGYNANIGEDSAVGWLAGFAYQIPEIALKASVTYRSEIKHELTVDETSIAALGANPGTVINMNNGLAETEITTPQSINLDLQTGIMANTVAFANVRWVNWKDFSIRPYAFGKGAEAASTALTGGAYTKGFNLVDYSDDQISATVGVGRKFNEQWAGNVSVGWDSGAGNPVSTLGPTEGYWNVGLGLQFSPAPNYFIAGGVKYFMLGDATAHSGAYSVPGNAQNAQVAEFEDNDAWAYGLKIGYKF
ncbi:OmpP1/FadL family transporter [Acinetobacter amyesii]|uniref:OmpP1/FadL family transporter n=1 Tax=Acinetobacter amyesii TaxID=2942470 RepID=UPI00201B408E|nr:outer membrane protein transport protein [Acinetobacter amyesii]MCL6231850.1 outer membrane protein transport protein [Acinetobacter amyesii]MCL6242407.1 outer membrane protein transport protein [Acinetobacter amyesii]